MTDPDDEQWLPVLGWESYYEVSDQGRVRSLDRLACLGRGGRIGVRRGRLLAPATDKRSGYRVVSLWASPVRRSARVHTLVLEAFVGPRPAGLEALHGNGNPSDNRLANLSWNTSTANAADVRAHGHHNHGSKDRCKRGHRKIEPNIAPHSIRDGHRSCRACAQALKTEFVRAATNAAERESRRQEEADRRYQLLMSGRVGSAFVDVERCVALYEAGWTGRRIAEEVGASTATVLKYIRRAGVEIRPSACPGGGRKPRC